MGMLLHHTLTEMEKREEKPAEKPAPVKNDEPETAEPVKKTGGRRKVSK